jgi:DNA mismatch repair protein MutL
MNKIKILQSDVINQIAAGEVVESPVNVVKELIENAIDASATKITIDIVEGGYAYLSVADNGTGMSKEDALLATLPHATSKLEKLSDLSKIHSMGFRGEALSSIAAVSKMEIKTSAKEGRGIHLIVEGGKVTSEAELSIMPGCQVIVRSLFYNVPARMRFQSTSSASTAKMTKTIAAMALAHPDIQFIFRANQDILLSAQTYQENDPVAKLGLRIRQVLGESMYESLIPIEHYKEGLRISGFIGDIHSGRKNRLGQYLFINKRWVVSPFISSFVKQLYNTRLATDKHPLFVLALTMPPHAIDVNIHPQKKEIRFQDNLFVSSVIQEGFEEVLGIKSPPIMSIQAPFSVKAVTNKSDSHSLPLEESAEEKPLDQVSFLSQSDLALVCVCRDMLLVKELSTGNLFVTPVEQLRRSGSMILFEKRRHQNIALQSLMVPLSIPVKKNELPKLFEYKAYFFQMGLQFNIDNKGKVLFETIPNWMSQEDFKLLLRSFLEGVEIAIPKKKEPLSEKQIEQLLIVVPKEKLHLARLYEKDLYHIFMKQKAISCRTQNELKKHSNI